ncbi:MAG: hypothetical protein A3D94_01670 [Alphaproteobacteria bacterium RIFCSPHIGHO2_12_FULL_66_14]|jgi:hypothetical protein|nr:MAG: hypothetical protein A3D94_01670 [Alphaproteobacteria bacterium RIFCSPHIGHO2_12_FULL_66_14]
MALVKWSERPRAHRWAILGAFVGMAIAAVVVFEYAFYGSTLDRYLIMMVGLLIGGGAGLLLASLTARRA